MAIVSFRFLLANFKLRWLEILMLWHRCYNSNEQARARARSCAMRASVRGCVQVYVYILFVPLLPLCCVFVHWTNENFNTGRTFGPGENIDVVQPINTRCLSLNWLLWLWLLILYLWADGISLLRPAATCAQCEPSENERERAKRARERTDQNETE